MSASDVGGAVVRELWRMLDEIQEMHFSLDPRDLLHNIGVLGAMIERVWTIASQPPPGAPGDIEAVAGLWRDVSAANQTHADDLRTMDVAAVWSGPAADGCTATVRRLADRFEQASPLAGRASRALLDLADEIRAARRRHAEMGDHLRAAANRLAAGASWDVVDLLRDVAEELVEAVRAAIDAYQIADRAAATCAAVLRGVADQMPFPDTAVPGMSVFELMNVIATPGDRPLVGDVAQRAADRYAQLGEGAQQVVDDLLASARSPEHRAWLLAALASGASLETLANFADRIGEVDEAGLAELLDPTVHRLVQQTSTTCGSASLVVARMLNDPVYALEVLGGYDATTGTTDAGTIEERFAAAELEAKARTNDSVGSDGERTLPWPDAIGTSPWGAAEEMNGTAGGDGYGVALVDSDSPSDRQQAYDALERAALDGRPALMYVGDGTIPRHVVLVVGSTDTGLLVYEPGGGGVVEISERDFVSGDTSVLGWGRPWAVVAP